MTRRRWIADEVHEDRAALTGTHAEHLTRVLRVRVGQEFDIVAGNRVRRGRVTSISDEDSRVEFELGEEVPSVALPDITLLLAIFKFDRMEWAIEKCTELGATRIAPVVARRTDPHLAHAAGKRVERWRRIAVQASEQSRRNSAPEITAPAKLAAAVDLFTGNRILLAEAEDDLTISSALSSSGPETDIVIAVGPEGGWTADELKLFGRYGWKSVTLGENILRAETAAIAALAVVMAECFNRQGSIRVE